MKLPDHMFVSESDGGLYDTRNPQWSHEKPLRAEYVHTFACIDTVSQFKATLRAGSHASGYGLNLVTADGALLCFDCGNSQFRHIAQSIANGDSDGWRVVGTEIYWEGPEEYCAHCGKVIAAEYGDPDCEESA